MNLFYSYLSLKNVYIAGLRKYFSKENKDKRSRLNVGVIVFSLLKLN